MKIKLIIFVLFSLIIGIIITLLTGLFLYPNGGIIGVKKWGFPFYWLSQVIYPGSVKIIHWSNLLIDILIWGSLFFMIIFLANFFVSRFRIKKSNKKIENLLN